MRWRDEYVDPWRQAEIKHIRSFIVQNWLIPSNCRFMLPQKGMSVVKDNHEVLLGTRIIQERRAVEDHLRKSECCAETNRMLRIAGLGIFVSG